jgi:isoleucyl-tRNA synthetase
LTDYFLNIIKEELNIKDIQCVYSDFENIIKRGISINLKVCGKKYGSLTNSLVKAANSDDYVREGSKLRICGLTLDEDEFTDIYKPQDDSTCVAKCSSCNIVIAIDATIDKDLLLDGMARDVIRAIQQYRKHLDLVITQRINIEIYLNTTQDLEQAIHKSINVIQEQTLCNKISIKDIASLSESSHATYGKIENEEFYIMIVNE